LYLVCFLELKKTRARVTQTGPSRREKPEVKNEADPKMLCIQPVVGGTVPRRGKGQDPEKRPKGVKKPHGGPKICGLQRRKKYPGRKMGEGVGKGHGVRPGLNKRVQSGEWKKKNKKKFILVYMKDC